LAHRIKSRGIVVWYDARRDFARFIDELRSTSASGAAITEATLGDFRVQIVEHRGSFFEVRALVERLVSGDGPSPVLIYLPGVERDHKHSVLAELEMAGDCYEPRFRTVAREVLRQRYSDGVIDDLLKPERV